MKKLTEFDWEGVCARWEAWHRGETWGPVFQISVAPPAERVKRPLDYLSMYDFSIPAGVILDEIENYLEHSVFVGDSFPSTWLNFGPGVLAAMVGGEGHNGENTVWFTPGRWEGKTPDQIHPVLDRNSPWFRRVEEFFYAARERQGRFHIGMADLGGVMDVLSTLLPGEKLLYALYDAPEEIKRISGELRDLWFEVFDYFNGILPENHGFSAWDGILSARPFYMLQCDFCYMISPEMFGEFVLPELRQSTRQLERSFYHLDGKGELPHLSQILALEELGGVQWIPGAGGGSLLDWVNVYRQIAAAGKKIWICPQGDFEMAARLIDEVGHPELFVIRDGVPAEREGELRSFIASFRK